MDTAREQRAVGWPEPGVIVGHWTVRDLETLPDDGLRYELIDGTLIVGVREAIVIDTRPEAERVEPPRVWPKGTWPPRGVIRGEWRVGDLELLPDDGLRYEMVEGTLYVSAAPPAHHDRVARRLREFVRQSARRVSSSAGSAIGSDGDVRGPEHAWQPDGRTSLRPDLALRAKCSSSGNGRPTAPLVVAEVTTGSSRLQDRTLKFSVYADLGVPQYWIVDPGSADPARLDPGSADPARLDPGSPNAGSADPGSDTTDPSVEVYDLADNAREYALTARATGSEEMTISGPVPVTLTPADLVA